MHGYEAAEDSLFLVALLAAGFVSVLALSDGFVASDVPESEEVVSPAAVSVSFESLLAELLLRLSVTYQPLPLKTTDGVWSTRFATPLPHYSQV